MPYGLTPSSLCIGDGALSRNPSDRVVGDVREPHGAIRPAVMRSARDARVGAVGDGPVVAIRPMELLGIGEPQHAITTGSDVVGSRCPTGVVGDTPAVVIRPMVLFHRSSTNTPSLPRRSRTSRMKKSASPRYPFLCCDAGRHLISAIDEARYAVTADGHAVRPRNTRMRVITPSR